MGDQRQNTAATPEDMAIERAEQQLMEPTAQSMQFLQSSVGDVPPAIEPSMASLPGSIHRIGLGSSNSASNGGATAAYSGSSGLLGAVAAVDLASAGSAMGVAAQVASAAPTAFGKAAVGPSVALSQLPVSNVSTIDQSVNDMPAMRATAHQPYVPTSDEFQHLQNLLDSSAGSDISTDALMSLLGAPGQEPDAAGLQAAIDTVTEQLALLNGTFESVFNGLDVDVTATKTALSDLSSTELGVTILSDATSVSTSLSDLLGTSNLSSNPQLGSLLNLGSTVDDVVSLVGSLPDLDPPPGSNLTLDPVLDPIIEPITGIVGGVLDPVTDPVIEPIVEPITDIVGGVLDPVTEPVVQGVEGVLPGLGVLSGTVSTEPQPDGDSSLLGSVSSGISSSASGSESASTGTPSVDFDPTK